MSIFGLRLKMNNANPDNLEIAPPDEISHEPIPFPVHSIKTRLQVQSKATESISSDPTEKNYTSTSDAFLQILRTEGLLGLYAGLPAALVGVASTNFAYFYWYSQLRTFYNSRSGHPPAGTLSTAAELLLGAGAGALATIFTIPVSVITTRQQTAIRAERDSLAGTARAIVAEDGIPGLWRGLKPSLVLCINPAITYGSFEKIKEFVLLQVGEKNLTALMAFYVGAMSKTLATVVTYPYIMAKVRLQWKPPKDMEGKVEKYTSAIDVLGGVLRTEGIVGWYKGMGAQITKAVLSQALLFMMKDIFTRYTILLYALARKLAATRAIKA
ncbi:mitochondrial carrier domain-containing protein [Jimgerdemannia flammicorona]|uniref:Mitochondrial carrier domain-containing protein n=1 Tax=Jimgerdemannia flammicorona TaxID=994334 RepID=A0A433PWX8_9FUNG|nr:mitochondrial carrier domain-containing protein [Jimgerdemannia flammicorona]